MPKAAGKTPGELSGKLKIVYTQPVNKKGVNLPSLFKFFLLT